MSREHTAAKHAQLVGKRFGRLVIEAVELRARHVGGRSWYAICICDCGKQPHVVAIHNLKTVRSCGCYRSDSTDQRQGGRGLRPGDRSERLVAIALLPRAGSGSHRIWLCQCDCGTHTHIREQDFIVGGSKSCGCLRRELAATRTRTHGFYRHPLYHLWQAIKDRCAKPNLRTYAGRGICVHESWRDDFLAFKQYVELNLGPKPTKQHSLDRIDVNKGYEPGNIRWAPPDVQARNKTNNRWIEVNGERLCVADWARRLGVCSSAIYNRLRLGWTEEEAVTTPFGKRRLK